MSVRIRAAVGAVNLTPRQQDLVGDVLLAAEALVELEPDAYAAQDRGMTVLREAWRRLDDALPGATAVFAAHSG